MSRLSLVLAAAMFVLVVDTSLMNVSIAAVVRDLDTTVSSVQSAIALEALVSAAFILISSKVGDLFGRKRAYVLGLLGYAIGAVAMTLAQSLTAIIIFWAIIGGLGASLLLPAMQSLIHGNFEGAAQKKTYALVGASAAIAAAVGPLLGGFVTTYLLIIPIVPRADSGWYLLIPLVIAGAGLGLLVSQLNNYTLAPIDEERISEAAGVNSASGSFGLSFGLAVAGGILLATLSLAFTNMSNASPVIPSSQQQQIAQTLEDDAQVVSNTQLEELLPDEPAAVQEEILAINSDATDLALQVALLVPILAGLLGLFNAFRMTRLPDIEPSASAEAAALA